MKNRNMGKQEFRAWETDGNGGVNVEDEQDSNLTVFALQLKGFNDARLGVWVAQIYQKRGKFPRNVVN